MNEEMKKFEEQKFISNDRIVRAEIKVSILLLFSIAL